MNKNKMILLLKMIIKETEKDRSETQDFKQGMTILCETLIEHIESGAFDE